MKHTLYIIIVSVLRILAMKDFAKSAHITICYAWIPVLYKCPALLLGGRFYHRRICHSRTSHNVPALSIFIHIFSIDLPDLTISIYIILIDVPWRATAQPAGRAVLTASTAVHGILNNRLTFFFSCILYENRFILHNRHPLYATESTWN